MKNLLFICFFLGATAIFAQNLTEVQSQIIHWDSLAAKTENGRTRRLLLEGTTTHLKYFRVHATTLNAGTAPNPPHPNKDADELHIIKEGKVEYTIGNKTKVVEAGGVAVILSDEVHGLKNIGNTPATYYVFRFQGKMPTDIERGKLAGGSILMNATDSLFKTHDKGGRRNFYNRAITQCPFLKCTPPRSTQV